MTILFKWYFKQMYLQVVFELYWDESLTLDNVSDYISP